MNLSISAPRKGEVSLGVKADVDLGYAFSQAVSQGLFPHGTSIVINEPTSPTKAGAAGVKIP